jgi:HSP20 family protein
LEYKRDDEKKKRKHHPFDNITDEEFERIFKEMQQFIDSESFRDLVEDILKESHPCDTHVVHGVKGHSSTEKDDILDVTPDDSEPYLFPTDSEEEPLADIIKDEEYVSVTIPLLDVQKKQVSLRISSTELEININRNGKLFYDSIELSALVDPETTVAVFNNGILDVVIKRKHLYDPGRAIDIL